MSSYGLSSANGLSKAMDYQYLLKNGVDCWNRWRIDHPNYLIDLSGTDLSGHYLFEANLRGVNLRGANLRSACLISADLRWANLSQADLRGTYLSQANLLFADLCGARLRGASLLEANLDNPNFYKMSVARANSTQPSSPQVARGFYRWRTWPYRPQIQALCVKRLQPAVYFKQPCFSS